MLGIDGETVVCRSVVAPRGGFGFGPRNCVFDAAGQWVYAVLERQNAVCCFRRDGSHLDATPLFTVSTLRPGRPSAPVQLAGAARLHPNGRCLYVANRAQDTVDAQGRRVQAGGENSVAVFALSPVTGEPVLVQSAPVHGVHPRCIDLDADGRTLVAATAHVGVARHGAVSTELPAGLTVFDVAADGLLQARDPVPVDVKEGPLFWAGFVRP